MFSVIHSSLLFSILIVFFFHYYYLTLSTTIVSIIFFFLWGSAANPEAINYVWLQLFSPCSVLDIYPKCIAPSLHCSVTQKPDNPCISSWLNFIFTVLNYLLSTENFFSFLWIPSYKILLVICCTEEAVFWVTFQN